LLAKLNIDIGTVTNWDNWLHIFDKKDGLFKKPVIMIIDEFDKLPSELIDQVVSMFRDMYLSREDYCITETINRQWE